MAKNAHSDESILNLATSKRRSLRTTVPAVIIDQFELKEGDKLQWKIDGDKLSIEMKKRIGSKKGGLVFYFFIIKNFFLAGFFYVFLFKPFI